MYMIAYVHTHPNTGSIKMFSPQDILYLARMVNVIDNSISPTDLAAFLVVNGETYAIRFDNAEAVQKLQDIYTNMEKQTEFISDLHYQYTRDNNNLNGTTSNIFQQQKRMLTFLNNKNLNISMYQANYTNGFLTHWDKYNDDGTKSPCN